MTKPLAGASFFGFLSDLGVRHEEAAASVRRVTMGDRHLQVHDRSAALQALIVGGAMVQAAQSAEAQGALDPDSSFDTLWTCGLVLIVIGAIWVGKTTISSMGCCLKRLHKVISEPCHPQDRDEGDDSDGPEMQWSRRRSTEDDTTPTEATSQMECTPRSPEGGVQRRLRQSGHEREENTSTRTSSMSRPMKRPSGSQVHQSASSKAPLPRSTSEVTRAVSEAAESAAHAAGRAADAAIQAAESAERASRVIHRAVEASKEKTSSSRVASSSGSPGTPPMNPWNRFQKEHSKRGWGTEKMRAEYYKAKAEGRQ